MRFICILCGPTGSGKTTLQHELVGSDLPVSVLCKATTRAQRPKEVDAVDYEFIDDDEFTTRCAGNEYLHIKASDYDSSLYGIPKAALDEAQGTDDIVLLTAHGPAECRDVKNEILAYCGCRVVLIYVLASETERFRRLSAVDDQARYYSRAFADTCMKVEAFVTQFQGFDYVLLNSGPICKTAKELVSIMQWEFAPSLAEAKAKDRCATVARLSDSGFRALMTQELRDSLSRSLAGTNERDAEVLKPLIAEYGVLRDEIKQYHAERTTHMNFAVITSLALIGTAASAPLKVITGVILFLPVAYVVFGVLYADRTLRIIRLADYIHNELRPRVCSVVEGGCWNWERYKSTTDRFPRKLMKLMDRLRWSIFIVPAAMCTLSLPVMWYFEDWVAWVAMVWVFDIACIAGIVLLARILEETGGAQSKES